MTKEWIDKWPNYCSKYDSLKKKVAFHFTAGMGGIGDFFKFFTYLLKICIDNDIKMYYLNHYNPMDEFIKNSYSKMNMMIINIQNYNKIENLYDITNIENDIIYIVEPYSMYGIVEYIDVPLHIDNLFYFSYDVLNNVSEICLPKDYISIHLRLGDAYLECDKKFVVCNNDKREYNETKLFRFIEENSSKKILFFCENATYKRNLKEKYNNIYITEYDIGHTSLLNTSREQYLNTITDFYLLTKSQYIYTASNSGFSEIASKFSNAPLIDLSSL